MISDEKGERYLIHRLPSTKQERRGRFMSETIIEQGYKLEIGRKCTRVTTYENLRLHTTELKREEKPKKIKQNIPSDYADCNY